MPCTVVKVNFIVLQTGCVTMWNLTLPLLQSNLRHHVRKPLTLAAQALEDIDRYIKQMDNKIFISENLLIILFPNVKRILLIKNITLS